MYVKMVMEMLKDVLYYAEITREENTIVIRIDDVNGLDFDKCIRLDMAIGILENEQELKLFPDDETDMKSNFSMVSADYKVYFSFSCNDKNEN